MQQFYGSKNKQTRKTKEQLEIREVAYTCRYTSDNKCAACFIYQSAIAPTLVEHS